MVARLDHVCLLVESLSVARTRAVTLGLPLDKIEEFEADGMRECYVGPPSASGRLLLVERCNDDGAYARALRLRGPGLHHLGIAVDDVEGFVASVRKVSVL